MKDAVSIVGEAVDMEYLLEYYDFGKVRRHGTSIRCACKLHGGDNPMGFIARTDNKLWYCHTGSCGGGDAFTLVQRIEECSFSEAVRKLAQVFSIDITNLEITERTSDYAKEVKKWIALMGRKKAKPIVAYNPTGEFQDVAKFRDFKKETIEYFGMKYAKYIELFNRDNRMYFMKDRLYFPIVQNGTMIGASLRRIRSTDVPKWSHQPASLNARELLYNYDALIGATEIVICEGIVDAWAWHEIGIVACATFGAHVTDEQYELLMKTGADLIWSFDGDEAGREATEKAIGLFKYKANQYVVAFADGEDPASITREELKRRYGERRRRI